MKVITFKRRQDQSVDGEPRGDIFWLPFVDDIQFIKCCIVEIDSQIRKPLSRRRYRIEMDGRAHEFFNTLKEAKIHLTTNILQKKG